MAARACARCGRRAAPHRRARCRRGPDRREGERLRVPTRNAYRTDRMRKSIAALFILLAAAAHAQEFKASDGVTLHYRSAGKGEAVVVLSGGPGFSADYVMPIVDHLGAKYHAVALDQRGTPRSP